MLTNNLIWKIVRLLNLGAFRVALATHRAIGWYKKPVIMKARRVLGLIFIMIWSFGFTLLPWIMAAAFFTSFPAYFIDFFSKLAGLVGYH